MVSPMPGTPAEFYPARGDRGRSAVAAEDAEDLDLGAAAAGRRVGDRTVWIGAEVLVAAAEHVGRQHQRAHRGGRRSGRRGAGRAVEDLDVHLAVLVVLRKVAGRRRLFPG